MLRAIHTTARLFYLAGTVGAMLAFPMVVAVTLLLAHVVGPLLSEAERASVELGHVGPLMGLGGGLLGCGAALISWCAAGTILAARARTDESSN